MHVLVIVVDRVALYYSAFVAEHSTFSYFPGLLSMSSERNDEKLAAAHRRNIRLEKPLNIKNQQQQNQKYKSLQSVGFFHHVSTSKVGLY